MSSLISEKKKLIVNIIFDIMLFFIIIVASIDTFFTIYTRESIVEMEKNPMAKFILEADNGLAIFISLKLFGTFLVIFTLQTMFFRFKLRKIGFAVTMGVFLFQLVLSYILLFYDPI